MQRLWSQGYLSGDQLRDMALHLLSDAERRKRIARVLLTRFREVVIDESQDCSDEDLRIVDMLRELDIPLLLVGDPDQSIYGFRNLVSLTTAVPKPLSSTAPDHRLTHNWRSTQVICDLAHTLRTSNSPCDTAVGPYHAEATPISLLPTTGRKDVEWLGDFGAAAEQLAIPQSQCLVVAHGNSTLPKGLTGTRVPPRTSWADSFGLQPSCVHQVRRPGTRNAPTRCYAKPFCGTGTASPTPLSLSTLLIKDSVHWNCT